MRTATDWPPSLAAATAWLAPLPPGNIWKLLPSTVSPGAGSSRTSTTKSMLRLPTTTIAGFISEDSRQATRRRARACHAGTLPCQIDAQLLQLFGVVAFLEQVPLLAAFGNVPLLRAHLIARQ